jgi:voltage-dependent potassium channel beta subunit
MEYRRLGTAGLKVSVLSFGSWVTFDTQLDNDLALDCMQTAWDAGVNFFDNAEAYAGGQSETIMGRAFAELGWPRNSYVVSTKFYWGLADGPNTRLTLNRKYLLSAIEASLERMGLEYVDLAFCHRSDPDTPMEEVVWAMHDMIERGQALYWGTSEWSAQEIRSAFEVAERLGLRPPVTEQPQYNMLNRDRLEAEYAPLFDDFGIGTTIWSPLASGLLTGKYLDGIPNDSRAALDGYEWIKEMVTAEDAMVKVRNLVPIADRLGCSMAQLAIAWAAKNPNVSTVITGASRASQVRENMAAMEVLSAIDAEVMAEIQAVLG